MKRSFQFRVSGLAARAALAVLLGKKKYSRHADVLKAGREEETEKKSKQNQLWWRNTHFLINLKRAECTKTAVTSNQSRVAADCVDYGLSYSAHMIYSREKEKEEEAQSITLGIHRAAVQRGGKARKWKPREERICKWNCLSWRLINWLATFEP